MTLTFIDLYNECAGQPWSMFDNDAESNEDFESAMKISINKAISFLWNYLPWSFRASKYTFTTKIGRANYELPEGIVVQKTIDRATKYGVKYGKKFLTYEGGYELLDDKEGEPDKFYVDGDNIYIYPTPDDAYKITISYSKAPFGLNEDEDELYELKEDEDYINIPEKYETIFKNCVISLAMIYAIADESDENHSGYLKQYEDALAVLIKYCSNNMIDRNFVW